MIFVDTSFFFAAVEPGDRSHQEAMDLSRKISGERLITTNLVRGETWTLMRYRSGFQTAVRFLDSLEVSNSIAIEQVHTELETESLGWLRQHDEREYSFVDATSFAFMRMYRISEALAFDGDFTSAGFVELRA